MKILHDLSDGLHPMRPHHTNQVADLLVNTFLQMNKIWSTFIVDKISLRKFFVDEIHHHFQSEERVRRLYNPKITLNFVAIHNNRLVGIGMHMEIDEYRQSLEKEGQSDIPLFRQLERQGRELIKAVDVNSFEKGKYVYATFGAHYKVMNTQPIRKVYEAVLGYDHMRKQGIRGMIFRSSSDKIVKMHELLGGVLLKQVPFIRQGKQFQLFFMQENFDNPKMKQIISFAKKYFGIEEKELEN